MNSIPGLESKKIVMLLGSTKPFPPNEYSNAASWLILQFIDNLPHLNIHVISKWHVSLEAGNFNDQIFHQVRPSFSMSLIARVVRLLPKKILKILFGITDPDLIVYFIGQVLILRTLKPDIVITHFSWQLFKLAKIIYPKAHHLFYFHSSNLGDLPKEFINFLFSHGDGIITICKAAITNLESKYGSIPIPSVVIYNGLDLSIFNSKDHKHLRIQARTKYSIDKNDIVLLYAGRLVREKGIDIILDAFLEVRLKIPNLHFIIVGDEKNERFPDLSFITSLYERVSKTTFESVTFLGWVPYHDMKGVYAATDISALASREIEGNSLFLMESMACGIPVISTKIGGVPEIIENNKTGLLIDQHFILEDFEHAIYSLAISLELRKEMGRKASRYIKNNHSSHLMANQLEMFLQEII